MRKPRARRPRAVARTRDEILLAAARAFAARGFKQARMEDIAHEAGFTAPALYSYFSSKDAMMEELLRKVHGEFRQPFRSPVPPRMAFRERVTLVVHEMLERAQKWSQLFEVFLAFEGHAGGERNHLANHAEFLEDVAAWFARAADGDELAGRDPAEVALVFTGICGAFFKRWLAAGAKDRLSDTMAPILDYFFHGLGGAPAKTRRSRSVR